MDQGLLPTHRCYIRKYLLIIDTIIISDVGRVHEVIMAD